MIDDLRSEHLRREARNDEVPKPVASRSKSLSHWGCHSTCFNSHFLHREVPSSPTPMTVADNANMFSYQEEPAKLREWWTPIFLQISIGPTSFLALENRECSKM